MSNNSLEEENNRLKELVEALTNSNVSLGLYILNPTSEEVQQDVRTTTSTLQDYRARNPDIPLGNPNVYRAVDQRINQSGPWTQVLALDSETHIHEYEGTLEDDYVIINTEQVEQAMERSILHLINSLPHLQGVEEHDIYNSLKYAHHFSQANITNTEEFNQNLKKIANSVESKQQPLAKKGGVIANTVSACSTAWNIAWYTMWGMQIVTSPLSNRVVMSWTYAACKYALVFFI